MRWRSEVSPAIGIGFLGACVSWWSAAPREAPSDPIRIPGFSGAAAWEDTLQRARERNVPVLVYARGGRDFRTLDAALAGAPSLAAALAKTEPIALDLSVTPKGAGSGQAVARSLNIDVLPAFVLVHPEADGRFSHRHLTPMTGAFFEPDGISSQIQRAATPGDDPINARAALPRPPRLARREADLGALAAAPLPAAPPDAESALEKRLVVELDKDLLYRGWAHAASVLDSSARAARATGEHLGVPLDRWERRVRETTRRAWIHCPDEAVVPFGRVLLGRYERSPDDIDSLDRAFLSAVRRSLANR